MGDRLEETPTLDQQASDSEARLDATALGYLIDVEIQEIHRGSTQAGWTTWALLGGIATCAWFLLSQLETRRFALERIYALWIIVSFTLLTISPAIRLLTPHQDLTKRGRFFYSRSVFSHERLSMLLMMVRQTFVLYFLVTVVGLPTRPFEYLSYALTSIFMLFFLFGFILASLNIPTPTESARHCLLAIAICFSCAYVTIELIRHRMPTALLDNTVEIRIAALTTTIYLLLNFLAGQAAQSPMLGNLVQLRRDLALQRITLENARDQLEIVLWGLRLADHVSAHTKKVIDLLQSIDADIDGADRQVKALVHMGGSGDPNETNHQTAARALAAGIEDHLIHAAKVMCEEVVGETRRIKWRVMAAERVARPTSEDRGILASVNDAILKRVNDYNSLVKRAFGALEQYIGKPIAMAMIDELNKIEKISFDRCSGEVRHIADQEA